MKHYNQAEEVVNAVLRAFENPNTLPKPLAQVFVRRHDNVPCRRWSWGNQLLVALHGYSDARGFRQWQNAGRIVKKGEKSFRILSPVFIKRVNEKTGEKKSILCGFRGTPVFGREQTSGKKVRRVNRRPDPWIEALPLVEVARSWGLTVQTFNGTGASFLGKFRADMGIALGVENLSTWAHELVHAADHRNGKFTELGQHWRSETVAELGGAVLLTMLGRTHEADLGGCWDYVRQYAAKQNLTVIDACNRVLERVCEAVALILDTSESLQACKEAQSVA